jgi:hypothetical protein
MSATIVRPNVQPSINYFDKKVVGKNVKRWVWYAGDVITPLRKAQLTHLAVGGDEVSSPCLQKYGRGYIPRGYSAMLELGGDLTPMEHLGDLRASAWSGLQLNESIIQSRFAYNPVYPGDGLNILRSYSMNSVEGRRGIDEDTALVGREWEECHTPEGDGILDVIEREMFSDGVPVTLRELTDRVRFCKGDSRIDMGLMRDDRLRMCEEFRLWGTTKMSYENSLVKVGTKGDWVYSYSLLGELLLIQLEMTRQDQPMAEMSRLQSELIRTIAPQQTQPAFDPEAWEAKMDAKIAAANQAAAARIAELEAQLAAKAEPEVQTWVCEHCGEEMKLSAKGFHVGRHCKVLHPKPETPSE